METGFFRFMNKKGVDTDKVYATSIISLGTTSLLFILLCFCFISPISTWMGYTLHPEHIWMMAIVVALDAFMTIPFAYLRHQKRPIRFASLKLIFIGLNVFFNLLFLVICPWVNETFPDFVLNKFYHSEIGIGYIFLANLLSTLVVLLLLIPIAMKGLKFQFNNKLLRQILKYSFPLLILGLAGVINQTVAQLTYKFLFSSPDEAFSQLGIYNACLKITVIITMFTQAFRYAYEPFFFSKNKEGGSTKSYADAMKYFVIFALLVFLGVMFYLDIIKQIIGKSYTEGIGVVPIAMLGEIFFGMYFNLSVWYKLTDKTKYGAYFSVFGCFLQVAINIIFVPIYGYMASAWATFICNLIIMTLSYFIGQKYYPVKYDLKNIFFYFILTGVFYIAAMYPRIDNEVSRLAYRTVFLVAFTAIIIKRDLPLSEIPVINRFFKRGK
jgi:O-antigen/teichoic acid export membrane protein